jgi:hypothetical protein
MVSTLALVVRPREASSSSSCICQPNFAAHNKLQLTFGSIELLWPGVEAALTHNCNCNQASLHVRSLEVGVSLILQGQARMLGSWRSTTLIWVRWKSSRACVLCNAHPGGASAAQLVYPMQCNLQCMCCVLLTACHVLKNKNMYVAHTSQPLLFPVLC